LSNIPVRAWQALVGPFRDPEEVSECHFLLALYTDVILCCECDTCRHADARAAAQRLRSLDERLTLSASVEQERRSLPSGAPGEEGWG
jgi:hypothetical protein